MPPQSLVSYIQEQLSKGYSIDAIRQNLVNYGYNASDVDEAVKALYQSSSVKHEIHLGGSTIIAIVAIFIGLGLIAAAIFLYLGQNKTPSQLLDINIIPTLGSVKPGDNFDFTVELSSLGSAKRFDVQLSYEITNANSNALLTKKEEAVALETRTSITTEIKIPETAEAGDYYLKANAKYGEKSATSSIMFKIYKKSAKPTCFDNAQNQGETGIDCGGPCKPCSSCSDNLKNQNEEGIDCGGLCPPCKSCPVCDDKDSCTEDSCTARTNFKCMYTPITPCCGNNKCESSESVASCPKDCKEKPAETTPATEDEFSGLTIWEKVERIKEMAASDPSRASAACKEISEDLYRDQCYMKVAEATLTLTNCDMITETYSKEKCYASLAKMLNNYNICDQITKESRKDSCFMAFVMDGDYTICDKIVNDYLKNSCNALASMQGQMNAQGVTSMDQIMENQPVPTDEVTNQENQ